MNTDKIDELYKILAEILKQDPENRFVSADGLILRDAVSTAAMQLDPPLLKILLSNETLRQKFFVQVDGITVFDQMNFSWFIKNRPLLPDSYTRFKNKIGLVDDNGKFISESRNIVLAFPYKDCVLQGGQTKDEQKRAEIFFNSTLARQDIDRLLEPKVFSCAKKFSSAGVEPVTNFSDSDNLIIKGNNLIAAASILKRFENKIKCIYIDVPYNTGNDSFGYNDRFNHSTWLTFMKNRLELAKKLLRNDGSIAISIDNYEIAYLLVLLDEIFGKENRKNIITVRRSSVSGAKVINPGVVNIVEYILIYSKNTFKWKPNRVFQSRRYDDRYNGYILNYDEGYKNWKFSTVLEEFAKETGIKKSQLKNYFGDNYETELENFIISHSDKICRFAALDNNSISSKARELKQKSLNNPEEIIFFDRGEEGTPYYFKNGQVILFVSDRLMKIDGKLTFSQPISDIWDDVLPNDLHNEGGVLLKKGKKPEKLISRILELCSNENDIVLDFFLGSGTTAAVAHKMKRQYIGVEQMDYIETVTVERLKHVIDGEQGGISKAVNWQGGGEFIYCELAKQNQRYVEEIQTAQDAETLKNLYEKISHSDYISYKVTTKVLDAAAADFEELSIENQKKFLIELLDKNLLYVNYCDMDDEDFGISDADKKFTRSFYGEG